MMEFKDCRKLLEQMPHCGGSTDDLRGITSAIDESDLVHEKRILSVSCRAEGFALVFTGEMRGALSGGGQWVMVQRNEDRQWTVTHVGLWAS